VEESGCWTDLPSAQTFHQHLDLQRRRPRTAEQLESSIRQEWGTIPLPKCPAAGLLSSQMFPDVVKRRGDAAQVDFRDVSLPSKPRWANIFHQIVKMFHFPIFDVSFVLLWIKGGFVRKTSCFYLHFTRHHNSVWNWGWKAFRDFAATAHVMLTNSFFALNCCLKKWRKWLKKKNIFPLVRFTVLRLFTLIIFISYQ